MARRARASRQWDIVTGARDALESRSNGDVWCWKRSGSTLYAGGLSRPSRGLPVPASRRSTSQPGGSNRGIRMSRRVPVWPLVRRARRSMRGQSAWLADGARQHRGDRLCLGAPTPWDPGAYSTVSTIVATERRLRRRIVCEHLGDAAPQPRPRSSSHRRRHRLEPGRQRHRGARWPWARLIVFAGRRVDTSAASAQADRRDHQRRRRDELGSSAHGTVFSWHRVARSLRGRKFQRDRRAPRSRIAAPTSRRARHAMEPGRDSTVRAIFPHGGTVFAGGSFQSIGARSARASAALRPHHRRRDELERAGRRHQPRRVTRSPRAGPRSTSEATSMTSRAWRAPAMPRSTPLRPPSGMDDGSVCDLLRTGARRPSGGRRPQLVYAAGRGGMEVLDGVTGAHVSWYPAGFVRLRRGRRPSRPFRGGAFGLVAPRS